MVPVAAITVLNPRARNRRVFHELVTSIAHLGLKRPISVGRRGTEPEYDLVCGQGRLEAFIALGQSEIPAIVIEASQEDCYVMSLVENLARRHPGSLELMREIVTLKERGYTNAEIAAKIDFTADYIAAICYLLEHGEERLVAAVERGVMPANIAMEIARAPDGDIQQALAEAYENKLLPGNQVLAIRRIVAQRNRRREKPPRGGGPHTGKVTAAALIQSYETEAQRQKLLVKKADLAQTRLTFVVNGLRRLLTDEEFLPPLRAEAMHTLPRSLADQLELSEVRMSDPVKLGFERQVVVLARCEILPMRRVLDRIKQTVRYKRIVASIAEVGIVEPLVVTRREVARALYVGRRPLRPCRADGSRQQRDALSDRRRRRGLHLQ
jgi:ParB family chromosome partitioning protein